MSEILEAVKTVGFPIVAFLLMFYQQTTTIKANTEAIKNLTISLRVKK